LPLCEKNEYVVETAFAVHAEILSTVSQYGIDITSVSSLLENILRQLGTLFKSGHSYDNKIYSGAAQLICEVARRLPQKLSSDDGLLKRYIGLAENSL